MIAELLGQMLDVNHESAISLIIEQVLATIPSSRLLHAAPAAGGRAGRSMRDVAGK
jgi:hypothetical protein